MNITDDQLKQHDDVSDTPRTETERLGSNIKNQSDSDKEWPWSAIDRGWDFARILERELAAVAAERDVLRGDLCTFAVDMERQLSASKQEAQRLREALDGIMESAKVAYCATTDPMMTDALVGIGKRCKDAIEND